MRQTMLAVNFTLAAYSELLLLFLGAAAHSWADRRPSDSQRAYLSFLILTGLVIAADMFSRLDGMDGALFTVCQAGNFFLFLLNPVMGLLWYLYVCLQIGEKSRLLRAGLAVQILLCGINAAAVIATPFTGWLYGFDSQHLYYRGPLFLLTTAALAGSLVCTEAILTRRRGCITQRHFRALFLFPVIPAVCTLFQAKFYGIAAGLYGTVFSLLIVFFYVQNRDLDLDYLTGLCNRRKLDIQMQQKISAARTGKRFSAIYLDIDHFKTINDTLGHQAGDSALIEAASLLRSVLRPDACIARVGSDEFCVLLDVDDDALLKRIVGRIRAGAEEFNRKPGRIYALTFSIGAAVYEAPDTLETCQAKIDALMYRDKQESKNDGGTAVLTLPDRRVEDRVI